MRTDSKIPRRVEFSETELPKSGSGKVLKRILWEPKGGTMPGYDRFWQDDGQRRAPIAPDARQTDPQQAVARGQFWVLFCRPVEHADLMA